MRTARLVGPTADGRSVVLVTEDGEELTVALDPADPDDALARSLLASADAAREHGDEPDPPPPAPRPPSPVRRPPRRRETPPMDTTLSPRDIQQRIRAGESLEDLVASSGMEADRVERFAAPVLAEREHMALTALSGSVRRRGEGSGHRPLRTVVAERLLGQGVDADDVTWDAWKREDGQWQVTADFELLDSERHAEFRFDPQGRFSLADDDDARWLAGERPSPVAAVVDRDDELALVRATTELGDDAHGSPAPGEIAADEAYEGSDEDDLEVTEDLVAVLQVVPPVELSAEELAELTGESLDEVEDDLLDPATGVGAAKDEQADAANARQDDEQDDEQDEDAGSAEDAGPRARDEAAEPTIAVVRRLTQVTVEVDPADEPAEETRSALDTLYDMLGGDGYAEDSPRVYPGLSDAAAVPVVDEHEFEPPADVLVPADPGPEVPERAFEAPEDTLVDLPTEHDRPTERAEPAPDDADADAVAEPEARPGTGSGSADEQGPASETQPPADVDEPLIPRPGAPRKPGRRKRASVPSWDEIMFGGPKPG